VNWVSVTEKVSLVPTVVDDSEPLAEISKRAFDTDIDVGAPSTDGPKGYDAPDFQARAMNWGDYRKILLEDELVGGLILNAGNEGHKIVERIFVDPDHHRKGIATRVFELMYEEYPDVKLWTLGTPEWNVRTTAFYEKLGFVQVGWDDSDPNWRGRWYERVMNPEDPYVMTPIEQLKDGMKNVDVVGKVLEKGHARLVRSRRRYGETLSVANAAIGDGSGRVVLVLWNEQIKKVQVGDRVRVENGYVSSYRGVTQLNSGLAGKLIFPI
jgi:GNAT superfamily N-acetyltransferase